MLVTLIDGQKEHNDGISGVAWLIMSLEPSEPSAPRNAPGAWDFFVSHTQRSADAKLIATDLYHSLRARG